MSSNVKTKSRKTNFVRITLDEPLIAAINETKQEYPLVDTIGAIKIILSKGIKKSTNRQISREEFEKVVKKLKTLKPKSSKVYNYDTTYKEAYHTMLNEKYDSK